MSRIKQISEHVRDHYAALLEAGQLVGVAVGGAEEALFDWDYNMLWANRNGFAKLALRTGAWHIVYTRERLDLLKKTKYQTEISECFPLPTVKREGKCSNPRRPHHPHLH